LDAGGGAGKPSRWRAPTWRRDVWREIDLVEEIARIEGYDRVPENWPITARPVELSPREQAIRTASAVLVGAGLCEAMTRSVVAAGLEAMQSPWGDAVPLAISPALVRGADRLRRTLLPSLLEARAGNVAVGAPHAELFEIARAYIARPADAKAECPVEEPLLVSLVTGGSFAAAKGLAEAVLARFGVCAAFRPVDLDLFTRGRAAEIVIDQPGRAPERIGVVGEFANRALEAAGLEGAVAGAELRLDRLESALAVEKKLRRPSDFPAVERDVNLVVDDSVPWGDLAAVVGEVTGDLLEQCRLVQVWKDAERLGPGKKSMVVSLRLRSFTGTLSSDEANRVVSDVVAACGRKVGAVLRQ
jgi:phenylalanyl-tRNA synthetase beta chain